MPSPPTSKSWPKKLRDQLSDGVIVLGSAHGPKAFLQVVVSGEAGAQVHAGQLVKALATHIRGGGGGRPDMAQAGGGTRTACRRRSRRCRRPYVRS